VTDTVRTPPAATSPEASGATPQPARTTVTARSGRTVRASATRWLQRSPQTWAGRASILAGSAAISLGISDAINRRFLGPGRLEVSTDVVGYPTVRDFDSVHYMELFALAAVVFPVVLGVSFLVLDRIVPRLFARFANPKVVNGSGVAARLAIPGMALGLGAAVAAESGGWGAVVGYMALGAVAYGAAVAAAAWVVERLRPGQAYLYRLSEANAVAVPLSILGVALVSASAGVTVAATDTVESQPFFPWPLAVGVVLAVGGVVAWRLRAAGPGLDDRRVFERDTVALIPGSVVVFLLTASLPGAMGPMDMFHEGESLATAAMLRDGAFPWRDLLFIHGPLQDGLGTILSFEVFGDTRWGAIAGSRMLLLPLCFVFTWILLARVVRSNWVILAGYPLLLAAGNEFFGGLISWSVALRMAFLPLVVLLAVRALRSEAVGWSVALGVAMFAAFVLTAEFIFPLVGLAAAVIGHDWVEGRGLHWRARFRRTLGCAAGGVATAAVFTGWLAANGALDDFVFYFRTFAPDHELTGAVPIDVDPNGFEYLVSAVLPWVLAVVTGAYFAWRLASKRALRAADWAMGSLALTGILFYPKFLARADGHVYAQIVFALPLLIYALARGLEPGDRDLEEAAPGRAPRHVLSIAVVGALLITTVQPTLRALGRLPDTVRSSSAAAAEGDHIGYSANALPAGLLDDMRTVIGAVGPHARVFDFSNQPATLYYLLEEPSPTRYFHVSMAIREKNQEDLVEELEADPPELVLYWGTQLGLTSWDGIINQVRHYDVSQYVLENYTPWLSVHGQLFYLRNDIEPPDVASFADELTVGPDTVDLAESLPPCDWGTAPTYLRSAEQVGTDGETLGTEPVVAIAWFAGWAPGFAGAPPERVLAVNGEGRVVSEARAATPAPDGPAAGPEGNAAFELTAPLVTGELAEDVHLVAVTLDGVAVAVGDSAPLPVGTELSWSGGTAAVADAAVGGSIEGFNVTAPAADTRIVRVDLPAGATESFDWLEMEMDGSPADAAFTLTNTPGSPVPDVRGEPIGQGIHFQALAKQEGRYLVQGAACPQWQGFGDGPMYLQYNVPNDVTLTLQRSLEPVG
jgi:hypothetical protein